MRANFTPMFKVDIMDEEGEMRIPIQDTTHLKYDIVLSRIDKQHGVHTIEHAEAFGLSSRKYTIVNIDE